MTVRVLVVTSRTAFAEALSVALRASDLDYVRARRAADAITAVQEELPGAVIIDLTSPVGALPLITESPRPIAVKPARRAPARSPAPTKSPTRVEAAAPTPASMPWERSPMRPQAWIPRSTA